MSNLSAKAFVADAIRYTLARATRPIGADRLASLIHCTQADTQAALDYLRGIDEVTHEQFRGWRYLPVAEAIRRNRARRGL